MTVAFRLSTLAVVSLFTLTPTLASQNEVNGSVEHWRVPSEQLWTTGYTRYFSELDDSSGTLKINPYLQRVTDISVAYSTHEFADTLALSGHWYINADWMLEARYADTDFEHVYSSSETADRGADYVFATSKTKHALVQAGYNLTRQWQIGGGLTYRESTTTYNDPEFDITLPNKNAATVFTRYTNVSQGRGWDMQLAVIFNEERQVDANARYFFSRGFSVEANYSDDDYNPGRLGLATDYWLSDQLSVSAGVGFVLENGAETPSEVTLGASYRF